MSMDGWCEFGEIYTLFDFGKENKFIAAIMHPLTALFLSLTIILLVVVLTLSILYTLQQVHDVQKDNTTADAENARNVDSEKEGFIDMKQPLPDEFVPSLTGPMPNTGPVYTVRLTGEDDWEREMVGNRNGNIKEGQLFLQGVEGPTWIHRVASLLREVRNGVLIVVFNHRQNDLQKWQKYAQEKRLPAGVSHEGITWYHIASIHEYIQRITELHEELEWPLILPQPKYIDFPSSVTVTPHIEPRTTKSRIPAMIHQTWKSIPQLSQLTAANMQHTISLNLDHDHIFWDDTACRELMTHFDPRLLTLYDNLRPGAFKADVWRLCALYVYGGVYQDIDMSCQTSFSHWISPRADILLVEDDITSVPNDQLYVYNALMACEPGHRLLPVSLRRILFNVSLCCLHRSQRPANSLLVTGPGALGLSFTDGKLDRDRIVAQVQPGKADSQHDRDIEHRLLGTRIATTKFEEYLQEGTYTGSYDDAFATGTWLSNFNMGNYRTFPCHPRIFDFCMYNGELEVLLIRLQTLSPAIMTFMICESNTTWSGRQKPYRFEQDRARIAAEYPELHEKIVYIQLQEPYKELNNWEREWRIRDDAFRAAIVTCNVRSTDYILMSDCDEIPRASSLLDLVTRRVPCTILALDWFHFHLNNYLGPWPNQHTNFGQLQSYVAHNRRGFILEIFHEAGVEVAYNGDTQGWHLSYFATEAQIHRKLQDYAHSTDERDKALIKAGTAEIAKRIREGGELFRHGNIAKPQEYLNYCPLYAPLSMYNRQPPRNIPGTIVTIWISSDDDGGKNKLPWAVVQRLRKMNPTMKHIHIDNDMAKTLLKTTQQQEVYRAMPENKYRADLLRFLYLYEHGGFYVDVDTDLLRPLQAFLTSPEVELYTVLGVTPEQICIGTFFVRPKHPAVKQIVQNMLRIGSTFANVQAPPWTNHPTNVAYHALCEYTQQKELKSGYYVNNHLQLDQEIKDPSRNINREAIYQSNVGLMAYSRYESYDGHGFREEILS